MSTARPPRRPAVGSRAVSADDGKRLEQRVARAAEAALQEHKSITAIDVLIGLAPARGSRVRARSRSP